MNELEAAYRAALNQLTNAFDAIFKLQAKVAQMEAETAKLQQALTEAQRDGVDSHN